jgi:hypothetical protein
VWLLEDLQDKFRAEQREAMTQASRDCESESDCICFTA